MKNININEITRIAQLMLRQQDGRLTPHEELDLKDWINSSQEHLDLYKKLSDNNQLAHDLLEMEQVNMEQRVKSIMGRIHKRPLKLLRIYRVAAAACVTALIVLGSYLVYNHGFSNKFNPQANKNTAPKKKGAILTLSDGQKIVLDSIKKDGIVAVQGNVQVIKKGDHIFYKNKNTGQPVIVYNTISTPKGSEYQLSLNDGTKVWLNAGSVISYPAVFAESERKIKLSGEAYFEVAPAQKKTVKAATEKIPFIVQNMKNDDWQVQVLGTHFNIYAYPEGGNATTTLLEGSVKIMSKHSGNVSSSVLTPRQQATINENGNINVESDVDVDEAIAWKNGKFIFQDTDLKTILQNIARWHNVSVIYKQPVNDRYTINIAKTTPLKDLLNYIEKSGGVHFDVSNDTIIVNNDLKKSQ